MLLMVPVMAQPKQVAPPAAKHPQSAEQKEFFRLVAQANVKFIYPNGFREIKAPDDEDFSFDYGLELPGRQFEIWFQVKSEKENWTSYLTGKSQNTQMANPDSVYIGLAEAQASAFTGDGKFFKRDIPPDVLARYHADAGKSYLLNLLDLPTTKHYKYALIISLQKNHTGTLMAIYFTNDKDPDFYKYVYRAGHCIKFKPPLPG